MSTNDPFEAALDGMLVCVTSKFHAWKPGADDAIDRLRALYREACERADEAETRGTYMRDEAAQSLCEVENLETKLSAARERAEKKHDKALDLAILQASTANLNVELEKRLTAAREALEAGLSAMAHQRRVGYPPGWESAVEEPLRKALAASEPAKDEVRNAVVNILNRPTWNEAFGRWWDSLPEDMRNAYQPAAASAAWHAAMELAASEPAKEER